MSLISAGALGNAIDRIRLGVVIDFIDVYWQNLHWPAFNIADISICIGACIFLYSELNNNKKCIVWLPGRNDYFYHYHKNFAFNKKLQVVSFGIQNKSSMVKLLKIKKFFDSKEKPLSIYGLKVDHFTIFNKNYLNVL